MKKLRSWVLDEIGNRYTPNSKFTNDDKSNAFLKKALKIATKGVYEKHSDRAHIRLFRRIRNCKTRCITDYDGYIVDENGKIYRLGYLLKELTQTITPKGYKSVNLNNGKQKTFLAHRLVALYHVVNPDPDKLTDVHHIDDVREHNTSDNLMWVSHVANILLSKIKGSPPREEICAYCGVVSSPPTTYDLYCNQS